MAQTVKNLPTLQETQVQSLGGEGPMEKEMTIHSSVLAWEIPWTEEPGRLVYGVAKESDTTEQLTLPSLSSSAKNISTLQLGCSSTSTQINDIVSFKNGDSY